MNRNDRKRRLPSRKPAPGSFREFAVERDEGLLDFLYEEYPSLARNSVKGLLRNHQVAVGGAPVTQFDFPLARGDVVTIFRERMNGRIVSDLPIIYEDEEFIVIDKPAGLLSVASDTEKGRTAYRLASDHVRQRDRKARIYVVHRIDEDTSGVLVFLKSERLRDLFQKDWDALVKRRGYVAIVEGRMPKKEDTLVDYLRQNALNLMYVSGKVPGAKKCVTHYRVIKSNGRYSLLDVEIMTGRKNQIRVQLGARGHHVIGDDKYGEPSDPLGRLGLHAKELTLVHPLTGKIYRFVAPVPKEIADFIK